MLSFIITRSCGCREIVHMPRYNSDKLRMLEEEPCTKCVVALDRKIKSLSDPEQIAAVIASAVSQKMPQMQLN